MKLSIIMPCYNVASTLARALESVAMQRVNFDYEVIIVNDASTDETVKIAKKYEKILPNLILINSNQNRGNAFSFYTGLCQSKGDYFCVLDGDDYYTIPDKLQRQIDFLDADTKIEYVGTCTNFVIDLSGDLVSIPDRATVTEFTYADFLTQNSGYYHTTTYVYRNIFRGNVPIQFSDELYRGDTPRTMFHLKYSAKKIKVLDFVGSAYTFEFSGIWSGLSQIQQCEFQINYQTRHKENLDTEFERLCADKVIAINEERKETAADDLRRYPTIEIDKALDNVRKYANIFAFKHADFVLKNVFYSEYIDTLCASLGYIDLIRNPEHVITKVNEDNLAIYIGALRPHGGGIFAEISELVDIYSDKNIYIFASAVDAVETDSVEIFKEKKNVHLVFNSSDRINRLKYFRQKMAEVAPYKTYFYCSHNDPIAATLPQNGGNNICLFSFDHGYVCGLSNPYISHVVAKRPVDYDLLKSRFSDRLLYIPTWNKGATDCDDLHYAPFQNHLSLITACGAARYYKVDGKAPYRYIDFIVELMKTTGGEHIHFGKLPDDVLLEVRERLEENGISNEKFIHIPWSDNIPREMLEKHVDVFIEPFPVVSYKLTLEVLSVGIPIIAHNGITRMNITDFVPRDCMMWSDMDDFIAKLNSLTSDTLQEMSDNSVNYFDKYHRMENVIHAIRNDIESEPHISYSYPDNTLVDICSYIRLFGNSFKIKIMDEEPKAEGIVVSTRVPRTQYDALVTEYNNVLHSKTYRIGHCIMFVPILMKRMIRKFIGR